MRFVICGNLTSKRHEIIESMLSNLELARGNGREELPNENPHLVKEPIYIRNRSVGNLYFYIDTFMRRRLSDPEADSLDLLNIILTETLYSKILGTAREKGLIYSMSSGYGQLRHASNWWFGAQVIPANAPALFEIVVDQLSSVFDGRLSNEDIEASKAYALGRFQRSAQTVAGVAGGYAYRYFFDDVIDDYYAVPKRIRAVSKKSIMEVALTMFDDRVGGFGVLGNCGIDLVRDLHRQILPLWDAAVKDEAKSLI
jgi:predicted Zn-dependent peptidase